MICSICIATYKRPELLEKLLESLTKQILPEDVKLEIIIVDNDPERSAEPVVQKSPIAMKGSFHYFVQPIKNISLTRNVAVENANGTYILFIDDDEVASRKWVTTHLKTLIECDADGVFGPVIPQFNETTPEWMKKSYLFADPHSAGGTGTEAKATWVGLMQALFESASAALEGLSVATAAKVKLSEKVSASVEEKEEVVKEVEKEVEAKLPTVSSLMREIGSKNKK